MPDGKLLTSVVIVGAIGAGLMVMLKAWLAAGLAALLAIKLKPNVPAVVGLPVIAPVPLLTVNPGGGVPVVLQPIGAVPVAVDAKL